MKAFPTVTGREENLTLLQNYGFNKEIITEHTYIKSAKDGHFKLVIIGEAVDIIKNISSKYEEMIDKKTSRKFTSQRRDGLSSKAKTLSDHYFGKIAEFGVYTFLNQKIVFPNFIDVTEPDIQPYDMKLADRWLPDISVQVTETKWVDVEVKASRRTKDFDFVSFTFNYANARGEQNKNDTDSKIFGDKIHPNTFISGTEVTLKNKCILIDIYCFVSVPILHGKDLLTFPVKTGDRRNSKRCLYLHTGDHHGHWFDRSSYTKKVDILTVEKALMDLSDNERWGLLTIS